MASEQLIQDYMGRMGHDYRFDNKGPRELDSVYSDVVRENAGVVEPAQ